MPLEVDIAITNNCNLKCSHCCYSSGETIEEDIPLDAIKKSLTDLLELGGDELHIAGGEPFVRKDLLDIVQFGKDLGYKTQILSNGYNIPRWKFEKLKEMGLDLILFSIDDLGKHHDEFRGQAGLFDSVLESIKTCKELGFYVRVNTVVTKKSMGRMIELNKVLDKQGVDKQSFFVLTPIGRASQISDLEPTFADWKQFKGQLYDYARRENLRMSIDVQKAYEDLGHSKCSNICRIKDRDDCIIAADGNVYPCYIFTYSKLSMGNIQEENIKDIWTNQGNWDRYDFNSRKKKNCSVKNHCEGGCLVYMIEPEDSCDTCDYRCELDNDLVPSCVRIYDHIWECK